MLRRTFLAALPASLPVRLHAAPRITVLAWSERTEPVDVYPDGINGQIQAFLKTDKDIAVKVAQLSDPDQGLSEEELAAADVVTWFGH